MKLSPKFYGPFKIIDRIGHVTYKLQLPKTSRIHNVFHVSQLKKHIGLVTVDPTIPYDTQYTVAYIEREAILNRMTLKRKGMSGTKVSIK